MTQRSRTSIPRRAPARPAHLGDRLRELRIAAGMTQSELAGDRFSKEYVSQIELGKTRPTRETIAWLASRLGVDASFLATGVSAAQQARVEAALARAEALTESDRYGDALRTYDEIRDDVAHSGVREFEFRALLGEGRTRFAAGEIRAAIDLLSRARELSEDAAFSNLERAEALLGVGACRYKLSSIGSALGLLNEALALAERSDLPSDLLRSRILEWRARCYRRQRDYEAAREDVERALELAHEASDARSLGHLYFQASLLAEREGRWVLARSYAERAKGLYEGVGDRANVGRLLNNLGGLNFLLGNPPDAIRHLERAFATALDVGSDADAAQAVSSLAQVHLRIGDAATAEREARQALALLDGREDFLDEIGNAQLVLGRALLEQGRLDEAETTLRDAETSMTQLSSASHRAAAWIAQGDLAARRGDDRAAARLYRQAAEALQDVRF